VHVQVFPLDPPTTEPDVSGTPPRPQSKVKPRAPTPAASGRPFHFRNTYAYQRSDDRGEQRLPDLFSIRRYLEEFLPILEGVLAVREFSDDLSVWQNHEWDAPMLMVESVGARL